MITPEQAQASLERERNAYWIRKNAAKVKPGQGPIDAYSGPPPNRAQMRANRAGGMIWSQRHKPARPSAALLRAAREAAAKAEKVNA